MTDLNARLDEYERMSRPQSDAGRILELLDHHHEMIAALRAVVGILDGHRTPPCLDCMHADCLMENDIRTAINDALGGTS